MLQVAAPIYKSTQSARQAVWVATASGLFEPLGALMAGWFLRPYVTDNILNALYCGGMLHFQMIPYSTFHLFSVDVSFPNLNTQCGLTQ